MLVIPKVDATPPHASGAREMTHTPSGMCGVMPQRERTKPPCRHFYDVPQVLTACGVSTLDFYVVLYLPHRASPSNQALTGQTKKLRPTSDSFFAHNQSLAQW